jgi:hypothetical protein
MPNPEARKIMEEYRKKEMEEKEKQKQEKEDKEGSTVDKG